MMHPESGAPVAYSARGAVSTWMRTRESARRKKSPFYGPERFTYLPAGNSYLCPAGEQLNYVGLNVRNRAHAYIGSGKRCGACSQKAQCNSGRYKDLSPAFVLCLALAQELLEARIVAKSGQIGLPIQLI